MNSIVRHKGSTEALALADTLLTGLVTRAGEPRADRLRAVLARTGTLLAPRPDDPDASGARRLEEALQAAALAEVVAHGGAVPANLVADGYAPAVVDAAARLATPLPGRSVVKDGEALVEEGDPRAVAVRLAEIEHDSRDDLVRRLPPAERGVLGALHKARKALAAGYEALLGRPVPPAAGVVPEGEAPAATARDALGAEPPGEERDLAIAILDLALAAPDAPLSLDAIVSVLGREAPDEALTAALARLTAGPAAPLATALAFRDERGGVHDVPPDEAAAALDGDLRHPVTGEAVPDAADSLFLRFSLRRPAAA